MMMLTVQTQKDLTIAHAWTDTLEMDYIATVNKDAKLCYSSSSINRSCFIFRPLFWNPTVEWCQSNGMFMLSIVCVLFGHWIHQSCLRKKKKQNVFLAIRLWSLFRCQWVFVWNTQLPLGCHLHQHRRIVLLHLSYGTFWRRRHLYRWLWMLTIEPKSQNVRMKV